MNVCVVKLERERRGEGGVILQTCKKKKPKEKLAASFKSARVLHTMRLSLVFAAAAASASFLRSSADFFRSFTVVSKFLLVRRMKKGVEPFAMCVDYVPCKEFEDGVRRAMTDEECGVHVLWGPMGLGKSCTVRKIAKELQEKKELDGVLFATGDSTVMSYSTPFHWLKACWRISKDEPSRFLHSLFGSKEKILVVLDQFDHVMQHTQRKSFLVSLAENSKMRKNFKVFVCVANAASYREILTWNNGSKIRPVFSEKQLKQLKWDRARLSSLYRSEGATLEKEAFLSLCEYVGAPGFLQETRLNQDLDAISREAKSLSTSWNWLERK